MTSELKDTKNNGGAGESIDLLKAFKNMTKENWYAQKRAIEKKRKIKEQRNKKKSKKKSKSGCGLPDNGFKPHWGISELTDVNSILETLSNFTGCDFDDVLLRRVEGIFALLINIRECTSHKQLASAIFLYVRDMVDGSVTGTIMKYVSELLDDECFTAQSSAGSDPNWLVMMRQIQTNWALIKANKAFKQFSKLLSMLISLGLCDMSSLEFNIHGFELFDRSMLTKHTTAFDFAEACFSTITFFAEGAYLCFKTGSLKPLLLNDFAVMELDEEYIETLSRWDLVQNGNLEKFSGMTDHEFERRLNLCISKMSDLSASLSGFDKKLLMDKLIKLKSIKNSFVNKKVACGTRRAPFTIEFHGPSGQGKTTISEQIVDHLLASHNMPLDPQYRAAINTKSKHMDNWSSDKLVAILDDLCNESTNFVSEPPTRMLIDICNNQMFYAPKAELEGKGKCFVEPEICVVTTNVKDLNARQYSNCPSSVQRRPHLVVEVKCKEDFRGDDGTLDSNKVRAHYTNDEGEFEPPSLQDVWTVTVERATIPEKTSQASKYTILKDKDGVELKDVSTTKLMQFAIEQFTSFRKKEVENNDAKKKRQKTMELCGVEGCNHIRGYCPYHLPSEAALAEAVMTPHFGLTTSLVVGKLCSTIKGKFNAESETFLDALENRATNLLYKKTNRFIDQWDWLCLVPEKYLDEESKFIEFCEWWYKDDIAQARRQTRRSITGFAFVVWVFHFKLAVLWLVLAHMVYACCHKSYEKGKLMHELQRRNDSLPSIIKNTRDKHAKTFAGFVLGAGLVYAIAKSWSNIKPLFTSQGALSPTSEEDVKKRDATPNQWAPVVQRPLPATQYSKEHIPSKVQTEVLYCLRYATLHVRSGQKYFTNVIYLTSNLLLMPNHNFVEDALTLEIKREHSHAIGGTFTVEIFEETSYHVPGTDLRLCYITKGGSMPDLTRYLPTGPITDHSFKIFWRPAEGDVNQGVGRARITMTHNSVEQFQGGEYDYLSVNTFEGMCCATLISEGKNTVLTGFHLGGQAGTTKGCFGTLTVDQVRKGMLKLMENPTVIFTGSAGVFALKVLGNDILRKDKLHEKSPINFLPHGSQFSYHGSVIGQSTSRSDVRKTKMSDAVARICGVENVWGSPKMKPEWFGWQKALENASHPGREMHHGLLTIAVRDYVRPLKLLIVADMWKDIKPLSMRDNINGIAGVRFIDALKLSTAAGLGMPGNKIKYIVEIEIDGAIVRQLTPEMLAYFEQAEAAYLRGERNNFVIKACKKDEILPIAKEKCRIFYANPMVLTLLVRKYFLPILRFLQMNPLVSECSVGINADGPEWDEFYKHAIQHGNDRIFGGDYGKYDQKLPSQLLLAGIRIMIDLAEATGNYTEDDLTIMRAMTGDLVYAYIAVNGDLVSVQSGTHISGNSLTAVLNGICGSLNLRCAFYHLYPQDVSFRDAVAIMTYGDDNIGSVHEDYTKFNIESVSQFLAAHGQIYTMPDKDSKIRPFLNLDEFEFLKRVSVFNPDMGCYVGALQSSSIFKSLHCYMRPKGCVNTVDEACGINLDNGVRNFLAYGRSVYEERRGQLLKVAQEVGIEHMCRDVHVGYDDAIAKWHENYDEV